MIGEHPRNEGSRAIAVASDVIEFTIGEHTFTCVESPPTEAFEAVGTLPVLPSRTDPAYVTALIDYQLRTLAFLCAVVDDAERFAIVIAELAATQPERALETVIGLFGFVCDTYRTQFAERAGISDGETIAALFERRAG